MSVRQDSFRLAIPAPLTQRDITVVIPKLLPVSLLVQAATFPTEELGEVAVPIRGQEIKLPTKFRSSEGWSFDVPDNLFTTYRYMLMSAYYSRRLFDAHLVLGNLADTVNDLTNPNLSSLFSIINNGAISKLVSMKTSSCTLKGCWIRRINPVEFSAQDVTTPILWRVSVHYNYIQPLF